MPTGPHDIAKAVEMFWFNILELEAEVAAAVPAPAVTGNTITSCLPITGSWNGAILLQCPMRLARRISVIMFGDSVDADDVQDCVGEISNMLAGKVQCTLPTGCILQLPTVGQGASYFAALTNRAVQAEVVFRCKGETFVVSLLKDKEGQCETISG